MNTKKAHFLNIEYSESFKPFEKPNLLFIVDDEHLELFDALKHECDVHDFSYTLMTLNQNSNIYSLEENIEDTLDMYDNTIVVLFPLPEEFSIFENDIKNNIPEDRIIFNVEDVSIIIGKIMRIYKSKII